AIGSSLPPLSHDDADASPPDFLDATHIFINKKDVFSRTFTGNQYFSMHVVARKDVWLSTPNTVEFKATTANTGVVQFSDIVLLYQHRNSD
ncbi:MAG TPA: hypothetical protein VGO40_23845, partial [Longimicrobium sp.]|nr:hypothetical protein [Longimicrobium sp.]